MWDANEHTSTKDMQDFVNSTGLVDVIEERYPDEKDYPPSHRDGSKKIDHIMVSTDVLPFCQSAGIETLGTGIVSDHRPMFLDVQLNKYLRGNAAHLEPPKNRLIHSRDPKVVISYVQLVLEYLESHQVPQRLRKAEHMDNTDPQLPPLLEQLDRDITRARLHAANKAGKAHEHHWSPILKKAKYLIIYWKLRLSALKNPHQSYASALATYRIKSGVTDELDHHPTESQLRKSIQTSAKAYQKAKADAAQLRKEYLTTIAEAYAKANNTTVEAELKKLKHVEASIQQHKRIKQAYLPHPIGSISYVIKGHEDVPDQWEIIHDPQEVEKLLLDRNHNHFGQAEGTPPTNPELQELLDHGYSDYSDQILEGTADLENVPCPQLKRLFQYLSTNNLPPISCKVTAEDLIDGYSNWNERTSTSYHSGLDLRRAHSRRGCLETWKGWKGPRTVAETEAAGQDLPLGKHLASLLAALETL